MFASDSALSSRSRSLRSPGPVIPDHVSDTAAVRIEKAGAAKPAAQGYDMVNGLNSPFFDLQAAKHFRYGQIVALMK